MSTLITTIHVITSLLLIVIVLIQSGKGAEISASFGGSSQTVFGSSGGANFFTRLTQTLAAIFMVTSLGLTMLSSRESKTSVMDLTGATTAPAAATPKAIPADTAPANTDKK